ncbi:long-chain fatty acid--CoA ligase [Paraferrimonas sp. SM1919]|uniref:long-chain fatty acid--CoA ligase n=1 Tax=Paraferrimonas sp. SM1919 TaxID=2662263 RepID=UPI0013D0F1FD|nr:long-chain fatty acid--CoA ligase [Paraferrimonas sp. SM1919]
MNGLMMDFPLTITSVMDYAKKVYPNVEIVSVTSDNPRHRYTYKDAFKRVNQLSNALAALGLQQGDRVATLAWNDYRHFELYYSVSCSGYVCHTINPRLFSEQIEFIVNHAEDQYLFTDPMFVPVIEGLIEKLPTLKGVIVLTSEEHMPSSDKLDLICYENFIAGHSEEFNYPQLEENNASSLCYTSGTTGNPKGVLYSHRSTVLHGLGSGAPNAFNISNREVVMPIVPMFHVNAWSLPYTCALSGSKIVFPGNKMADGPTLTSLINDEGVTFSAGVPTVWLALYNYLKAEGIAVPTLERCIVGGSACPLSLINAFRDDLDVNLQTAWGLTETSPLGSIFTLKPELDNASEEELDKLKVKQGLPIFGVDSKIVDFEGNELPWDGTSFGQLKVRGPWVAKAYYNMEKTDAHEEDGWFDTGDIVTYDKHGYMQITDRSKDLIKSGGEWISSIELENLAVDHPEIAEAAAIGYEHEKWGERPMIFAVRKEGSTVSAEELIASYQGKIAKWCIPDIVEFVDELPHTATGKLDKKVLRQKLSV